MVIASNEIASKTRDDTTFCIHKTIKYKRKSIKHIYDSGGMINELFKKK